MIRGCMQNACENSMCKIHAVFSHEPKTPIFRHFWHFGNARSHTQGPCAVRLRSPCCALTADRGRNRSVVDRGRDLTQNLTLVDRAPALLAAMMESATIAEVDGSATETHDASQVSGAIGEGHGELSDSNCATGRAMARRVGPVSCPNNLMCAFAYLLVGMARPHGRTGRDP